MKEPSNFTRLRPVDSEGLRRGITGIIARDLPLVELTQALCKVVAEHAGAGTAILALADGRPLHVAGLFVSGEARAASLPAELHAAFEQEATVYSEAAGEACLAIPLSIGGKVTGAIGVRRPAAAPFAPGEQALLESGAPLIAAAIRIALDTAAREEFATQSTTDALTGVGNRRHFEQTLATEWKRCARLGVPLALVLLDIDFFKAYNDRYGHLGGDACLQTTARACNRRINRTGDVFCRYGGEEFAAVLPGTDQAGAIVIAEELRATVAGLALPNADSTLGILSISLGAAALVPHGDKPADLVALADACLYDAKHAGRNRVAAAEYRSSAPAAQRIHSTSRSNLPAKTSLFYGRAQELADLEALLEQTRLLTIAGPGGVGKTRIALELGRPLVERKPVWFVDLAPVTDPASLHAAVCDAAGLGGGSGTSPAEALTAAIESEGALLILDNCEHVVAACAQLAEEFLHACPALQIVATSREPLGIDGELVYRLPVLSLPRSQQHMTAREALEFDGVRMFVERAKLASPGFEITDENADCVARVCNRLDGIALAIELAGPRLKMFTLEQFEEKLNDRFRVLTGDSRTALARQQTLESVIRWSYELLTPDEQRVLANVSVLVGAWPLEAALAVDGELDEVGMLNAIGSLADKSLLFVEPAGEENWYRLLESTREFAALRLAESGSGDLVRHRLIVYYHDLLAQLRRDPIALEARVAREYPNVQTALGYAFDEKLDPPAGVALAMSLGDYWNRTHDRTQIHWIERALEYAGDGTPEHRALSLQLAPALMAINEFERTESLCRPLIDACLLTGDRTGYRRARRALAGCVFMRGEFAVAKEHLFELLKEPIDDPNETAAIYNNLGVTSGRIGQFEEAIAFGEQSLRGTISHALYAINAINHVAQLLSLQRSDEAIPLLESVLRLSESVVGTRTYINALALYGYCMLLERRPSDARSYFRTAAATGFAAIRAGRKHEIGSCLADTLFFFAQYAFSRHDYRTALTLLAFTQTQTDITSFFRLRPFIEEIERIIGIIRGEIGEETFAHDRAAGQAMTLTQAENIVFSL